MKGLLCLLVIAFAKPGETTISDDLFKIIAKIPFPNFPATTVEDEKVTFHFFDRTHPKEAILLTDDNWDLIDTKKPTVYIIHGWTESRNKQWYADMTAQYLIHDDLQVIQVDWSGPASAGYPEAAQNTRGVGKIVARHVIKSKVPLSLIHIVGHSLGGQTAGFAGKEIRALTGGKKVQRITGLDAAGPLFIGYPDSQHLCKNDAVFVDSVHTDSGILGFSTDYGHVDFYPNGGTAMQAGCLDVGPIHSVEDVKKALKTPKLLCSHHMSWKIWIDTINKPRYKATECRSWLNFFLKLCSEHENVIFGEDVPPTAKGKYFFSS